MPKFIHTIITCPSRSANLKEYSPKVWYLCVSHEAGDGQPLNNRSPILEEASNR